MTEFETRGYGWLIGGGFFLLLAVVGTLTGKTLARFGGVVYRVKEPKQFWWLVAIYYLGGVLLIGFYLYNAYGVPS